MAFWEGPILDDIIALGGLDTRPKAGSGGCPIPWFVGYGNCCGGACGIAGPDKRPSMLGEAVTLGGGLKA